jgi:hypothetical protein
VGIVEASSPSGYRSRTALAELIVRRAAFVRDTVSEALASFCWPQGVWILKGTDCEHRR